MTVADQLRNEYKPQFIAEGIEKGIEKVARNMLADNEPIEKIMRATDLTETQLAAIKNASTIH